MMLALAATGWWLVFWDCSGEGMCTGRYWPQPFDDLRTCATVGRTMQRWERAPFACRETIPADARPMQGRADPWRLASWH